MPIENERKYVLLNTSSLEKALQELSCRRKEIRQFYVLVGKGNSLRLRETVEQNKEPVCEMTYKQRENGMNRELEMEISYEDYLAVRKKAKTSLCKTRYYYHDWEIDFFRDSTGQVYFVQAEIELPANMAAPKEVPSLIQDHLLHFVERGDNRFSSRRLADIRYAKKLIRKITIGSKA